MNAASSSTVTKRLHVSGLTPNITSNHLQDRFKIFGQVNQVEEPKPNALGDKRPFAYVTVEISPVQLKRCMNTLSGSMYRGAQLRIAEAKPAFVERVHKENHPTAAEKEKEKVKKRKRVRRDLGPEAGREAQDMRVITPETSKRSKFWLMSPDGHLVRPMAIRPTRPIPSAAISPKVNADSAGKKLVAKPPSRLRQRVINPLKWAPFHLADEAFMNHQATDVPSTQEWIFEEGNHFYQEEEASEHEIIGRWRNTETEEEQVVRIRSRVVAGDHETDAAESEGSDLDWPRLDAPLNGDRSPSPLFDTREVATSTFDRLNSPSTSEPASSTADEGETTRTISPIPESADSRSSSPLFPVHPPKDAAKDWRNDPQKPVAIRQDLPPALLHAVQAERSRELELLSSFLQDPVNDHADQITTGRLGRSQVNEWGGYEESDSEDDFFGERNAVSEGVLRIRGGAADLEGDSEGSSAARESHDAAGSATVFAAERYAGSQGVLRLRGGAVDLDGSEDSDSESTTSSDSSDSSDSASSSDTSSSASSGSSSSTTSDATSSGNSAPRIQGVPEANIRPALSFAASGPSTGLGFSLAELAGDVEMDEELDIPLGDAAGLQSTQAELQPLTITQKQIFDPSPDIPLFFPPTQVSAAGNAGGRGWAQHPMVMDQAKEGYVPFLRLATDAEMRGRWEEVKGDLTIEWKRRGREARKQRKRKGGGADDE